MKMQSILMCSVVLLTALLACRPSTAQDLSWKFKAGDSFRVALDQETMVTTEYNLIKRRIGTQVSLNMDWSISAVAGNGNATIQQTITNISMVMTTPTQDGVKTIEVDSTKTATSEAPKVERDMWKQVQPLIGATFDVEMQTNGQIVSVTATEQTKESIRNANGSMRLRELLTAEGLTQLFSQSIIQIPNTTSEPWQVKRTQQTDAGSFESTQTFTLQDEEDEDEILRISSTSETTQPKDQKGDNELVKGVGSGELVFDKEAGYFTSSRFSNELSFTRPYRDSAIATETTSRINMKIQKVVTRGKQ